MASSEGALREESKLITIINLGLTLKRRVFLFLAVGEMHMKAMGREFCQLTLYCVRITVRGKTQQVLLNGRDDNEPPSAHFHTLETARADEGFYC